jgi:uncharacterized protein with PIN domain
MPQNPRPVRGPSTKALYQWLFRRASFFRSPTEQGVSRTVRTEVIVERRGMTVLVGGADFEACPFCGQKLAPVEAEQAKARLKQRSISTGNQPRDSAS